MVFSNVASLNELKFVRALKRTDSVSASVPVLDVTSGRQRSLRGTVIRAIRLALTSLWGGPNRRKLSSSIQSAC